MSEGETSISCLPDDVMLFVFNLLMEEDASIKCVMKLKCVCKSWRAVIDKMADSHLRCMKMSSRGAAICLLKYSPSSRTGSNLLRICTLQRGGKLKDLMFKFISETITSPPLIPFIHYFRMLPSINGLLCIRTTKDVHVCNPITQDFLTLPSPSPPYLGCPVAFYGGVGFGYDPLTNHYKLVRIFNSMKSMEYPPWNPNTINLHYAVFTLGSSHRSRSWRISDDYLTYPLSDESVHINGKIYWTIRYAKYHEPVIISFDVSTEKFVRLNPPAPKLDEQNIWRSSLIRLGERLCIGTIYNHNDYNKRNMQVWALEDHQWIKSYKIIFSDLAYFSQNMFQSLELSCLSIGLIVNAILGRKTLGDWCICDTENKECHTIEAGRVLQSYNMTTCFEESFTSIPRG